MLVPSHGLWNTPQALGGHEGWKRLEIFAVSTCSRYVSLRPRIACICDFLLRTRAGLQAGDAEASFALGDRGSLVLA